MTELKLTCKKCGRYLGRVSSSAKIEELICPKCKNRNSYDIRMKSEAKNEQ